MQYELILFVLIFIYGIVIGSFLNVCIYRIPNKENIATKRSHCMSCNHQLKWYDLVPLISWITLAGKCRYCKTKISIQYPLIEFINGVGYVLIFYVNGINLDSVLFALCTSALLVLSVIDIRIQEIPVSINIFIFTLGILRLLINRNDVLEYVIGFFTVSGFLLLVYWVTKGRGIGGGDIKLMAVAGLFIGFKAIIVALILGCILGSIIHIFLMVTLKKGNVLAFGPYLSMGIFISMIYGEEIINWYLTISGIK